MGSRENKGRRSITEEQITLSRVLSLWHEKGDVLTFKEIHEEFVRMGIISNIRYRSNTRRILKRLIKRGYIEQVDRGKYRLRVSPKPFQVTDLINEIRGKYGESMIYEWRVGGIFWTLAEGIIFGLPHDVDENPIYRAMLNVLLMRLASIFDAIVELSTAIRISSSVKRTLIPYKTVREFVLNILPHIIGERSGIDWDGLLAEDIIELYNVIIEHLPREVNNQPILIDLIKEHVEAGKRLLKKAIDVSGSIDETLAVSGENRDVWSKVRELEKTVLVIYPPRHLIDENEDERELYEMLKYLIEEGNSDALLLAHMRVYEEDVVRKVMSYLKPFLGEERVDRLMHLYKLARAGMILDGVVETYLSFKEKKGKPKYIKYEDELGEVIEINEFAEKTGEEVLSELRKQIDEARKHGYALKNMLKGIWLSDWSLNIVPRFVIFHCKGTEDTVTFVKKAIRETLEAIGVKIPRNFETLIEQGHRLVKKLDEILKNDRERMIKSFKEKVPKRIES